MGSIAIGAKPQVLSSYRYFELGLQRRQAECSPRRIAIHVRFAIGPGRIELPASAGTLIVNRALHGTADLADQPDAAGGFAVGAEHGDPAGADRRDQIVGHRTPGRGAFTPEKRHAKMRTAGTAIQTRTGFGHGRLSKGWGRREGAGKVAILGFATALGRGG